ncbi:hypothetical protein K502DRAFT_342600, partial [Neoconidiobolus thromboides FSU 785]
MPIERWFCYNHQMMHRMEEQSNNSNKNENYLHERLPRILCPSSDLSSYSEEHKSFRASISNDKSNESENYLHERYLHQNFKQSENLTRTFRLPRILCPSSDLSSYSEEHKSFRASISNDKSNESNQSDESVYSKKPIPSSLLKGLSNDVIVNLKEIYNKQGDSKSGDIHIYATLPPGNNKNNSASKSTKSKLASWKSGGKVYYKIGTSMDIRLSNRDKLIQCPVFKSCCKSDSPLNVNYLLSIQCNDIYKLKELIKLHLKQKLVPFGKASKNICKGCESNHEDWFLVDRSIYFKLLTEGFVALKDFYPGWKNIKNIVLKWSDHIN